MLRICLLLLGIILTASTFSQSVDFVKGSITDNKTNKALNNVELTLHNMDSTFHTKVRTNKSGIYQFKNIPFGDYIMSVTDQTYVPVNIDLRLTEKHAKGYTFDSFAINRKVSWLLDWGDSGDQEHYWSHLISKIIIRGD